MEVKYNQDYLHQEIKTCRFNIQTALGHIDEGIQYEINCLKQESQEINYDSLNAVFELRDTIEKALEKAQELISGYED